MLILILLLLMSATLFPIGHLYNPAISPKWYATVLAVMMVAVRTAWIRKSADDATVRARALSVASVAVLAYNLSSVLLIDLLHLLPNIPAHQPIAGVFDNPTGYAMNTCILMSIIICGWKSIGRQWRCAAGIVLTVSAISVLASQSRTGIITVAMLAVWSCFHFANLTKTLRVIISVSLFAGAILYAASTKHNSTSGRSFILARTIELISERPLTGHGSYGFEREYMKRQAEFFIMHPDSGYGHLADDIRHPLNEFLYCWVNWGIIGIVGIIALFAIPVYISVRYRYLLPFRQLLPMLAVLLFALSSYPSIYPLPYIAASLPYVHLLCQSRLPILLKHRASKAAVVATAFFISVLTIHAATDEIRWNRYRRISLHGGARAVIEDFAREYSGHRSNPYFLFSHMVASYKAGKCQQTMDAYKELSAYWSDYQMELIAGDACRHMQKYGDAINHYHTAHNMIPLRFAPLHGMLNTFISDDDTIKADSMARQILSKQVKIESYTIHDIQNQAGEWLRNRETPRS